MTAVVVSYVDPRHWFAGGKSLASQQTSSFWLDIKVVDGTNTKQELGAYVEAIFAAFEDILGMVHPESYVLVHEGTGGSLWLWRQGRRSSGTSAEGWGSLDYPLLRAPMGALKAIKPPAGRVMLHGRHHGGDDHLQVDRTDRATVASTTCALLICAPVMVRAAARARCLRRAAGLPCFRRAAA